MTERMSEGIIELVRRSSVKHPRAKSVLDADPKFQTKKKSIQVCNLGDNAVAGIRPQKDHEEAKQATPQEKASKSAKEKRDKKKYVPQPPVHVSAVTYVNNERKREGLPESTVDEMALIEERLARKDLAKGGSIKSEIDSYLDTQSFSRKIVTANWADRVAKELVEWINRPRKPEESQPMKITEFFREKGIFHRDFYLLAKKYEILQKALDYALQALGDIRERNVLEGKWNPNAGMFMMGHYDENWRKEQERREAAKVKQAEATAVDFKALMLDMTAPVAPTEEVRAKLDSDNKRKENGTDR